MSVNQREIHRLPHLFVVTLLFSLLPNATFILYSLLRESVWEPYEHMIVAFALCACFSALGERLSKIKEIGTAIFIVSMVSASSNYLIFRSSYVLNMIPSACAVAEKIAREFSESDVKYASVHFEKKLGYKSTAFLARAIGRILVRLGLKDKISVYSDSENVYLERT